MFFDFKLKPDGYVAKILTWHFGDNQHKRNRYLAQSHPGCNLFWIFLWRFTVSLGGLREAPNEKPFVLDFSNGNNEEVTPRNPRLERCLDLVRHLMRILRTPMLWCLAASVVFSAAIILWLLGHSVFGIQNFALAALAGAGCALAAVVVLFVVLWAFVFTINSELMRLFFMWTKSQKEKVCPMVTFD